MSEQQLVVVTNGPGELMGWVRPFLRAALQAAPALKTTIVFVPCTYATGREPAQAKALFPSATVVDARRYAGFLLGRKIEGLQRCAGALQYLGGDLFHALTIAKRLGLAAMTYKFSKRAYARAFARFFALDEANAAALARDGAPRERVRIVGNLVPDSVLGSVSRDRPPPGIGEGVCMMPGSRPAELKYMLPFFLSVARSLKRRQPCLNVSFAISPFNTAAELKAAVEGVADPAFGGVRGRLQGDGSAIAVQNDEFPVDRSEDYRTLARAQLVITIPGTKCLEAAVLGRPTLVTVPHNRMDEIALSGIGGYLHYLPLIGRPLKARLALMFERRFRFVAQPNMDAGRLIAPEMRGVLSPADVSTQAARLLEDLPALRAMGQDLAGIYALHAGASLRMAEEVLAVLGAAPGARHACAAAL